MGKQTEAFKETQRQQRLLQRRLAAAPVVTIVGVVDPSGAAGLRAQGERLWTLTFTLVTWRSDGGEVRTTPLTVSQPMSERQMSAAQNRIQPYGIFRMRARVLTGAAPGDQARLVKLIGPVRSDRELVGYAQQLQRPVRRKDPLLGTLILDRRARAFDGKARWNGKRVSVSIDAEGDEPAPAAMRTAHALWKKQADWSRRVIDYAVAKMLPVMKQWRDEESGEPPITEPQLRRRIKLESISVYAGGEVNFFSEEDEIWGYHAIQVRCDPKKGPFQADLIG